MSLEITLTVFMSIHFEPAASIIIFFSAKAGSHTCGSMCSVDNSTILEPINHWQVYGSFISWMLCEAWADSLFACFFFFLVSQVTGLAFQTVLWDWFFFHASLRQSICYPYFRLCLSLGTCTAVTPFYFFLYISQHVGWVEIYRWSYWCAFM